jgi:hypothetical protein
MDHTLTASDLAALLAAWWEGHPDAQLPLADALEEHGHDKVAAMVRASTLKREGGGKTITIDLDKVVDVVLDWSKRWQRARHFLVRSIIVRPLAKSPPDDRARGRRADRLRQQ